MYQKDVFIRVSLNDIYNQKYTSIKTVPTYPTTPIQEDINLNTNTNTNTNTNDTQTNALKTSTTHSKHKFLTVRKHMIGREQNKKRHERIRTNRETYM